MSPHNLVAGIDPGNTHSAIVIYDTETNSILHKAYLENEDFINNLPVCSDFPHAYVPATYVIERVASYGMPVGETVFETVFWSGRFAQKLLFASCHVDRMKRIEIKNILCHSSRAKDGNIRQVLIDKIGLQGTKKNPGPTYGMSGDLWAALAVAVSYSTKS